MDHKAFSNLLNQYNPGISSNLLNCLPISNHIYADNDWYTDQVKNYALSLDKHIREKLKKNIPITELSKINELISFVVVVDILNAKVITHAAKLFAFWVDVAVFAGNQYKNLNIENAIIAGLSNPYITKIFDKGDMFKGDKIGYQYLPKHIKENSEILYNSDRYKPTLSTQTEYVPPLWVYTKVKESSKEASEINNSDNADITRRIERSESSFRIGSEEKIADENIIIVNNIFDIRLRNFDYITTIKELNELEAVVDLRVGGILRTVDFFPKAVCMPSDQFFVGDINKAKAVTVKDRVSFFENHKMIKNTQTKQIIFYKEDFKEKQKITEHGTMPNDLIL